LFWRLGQKPTERLLREATETDAAERQAPIKPQEAF
jgi:hypothetical protein